MTLTKEGPLMAARKRRKPPTVDSTPKRVIALDRDGVINVDKSYVHRSEDWEWCPGAPEALRELKRAGYHTAIITDQSGVGRGYYTKADYFELMAHAQEDLFYHLGHQSGYFPSVKAACFHAPEEGCECRKPGTKLWHDVIVPAFGPIDMASSWFVDDKVKNMPFGQELGLNTVLIGQQGAHRCDYMVFGSLHHFAETLLKKAISWTT